MFMPKTSNPIFTKPEGKNNTVKLFNTMRIIEIKPIKKQNKFKNLFINIQSLDKTFFRPYSFYQPKMAVSPARIAIALHCILLILWSLHVW